MAKQNEPMEHLLEVGTWLQHAHTSDDHRRFPSPEGVRPATIPPVSEASGVWGAPLVRVPSDKDYEGEAPEGGGVHPPPLGGAGPAPLTAPLGSEEFGESRKIRAIRENPLDKRIQVIYNRAATE